MTRSGGATPSGKEPGPGTAWGVFNAISAGARHVFGRDGFKGLTVAVQGLGHVGYPLCKFLHERGARLAVSGLGPQRVKQAQAEFERNQARRDRQ